MHDTEGASLVEWRGRLYLFGGTIGNTERVFSNDVFAIELDERGARCKVTPFICQGRPPPPTAYHAASVWQGRYMVVCGGCTAEVPHAEAKEDTVYVLDLEEREWFWVQVGGEAPLRRCNHSLVTGRDALMLYGGYPPGEGLDVEKVTLVHSVFFGVYELQLAASGRGGTWTRRPCSSAMPPMLWGHVSLLSHQFLVVFGGVDIVDGNESSTVCVWLCDKLLWRWVEFNRSPLPRAMHVAGVTPDGNMIVFGGVGSRNTVKFNDTWVFSLEAGQWAEVEAGGALPAPRSGHCAAMLGGKMVVVGGIDAQHRRRSDVHTLDVHTGMWSNAVVDKVAGPPRPVHEHPQAHPPPPVRGPSPLGPPPGRGPSPLGSVGPHMSPQRPSTVYAHPPPPPSQSHFGAAPLPLSRRNPSPSTVDHIVPWTDDLRETEQPHRSEPPREDSGSNNSLPPAPRPAQRPPPSIPPPAPFPSHHPQPPVFAAAPPGQEAQVQTSFADLATQAVQTEPLPSARPSPRRQERPPPPPPEPVLVPVESAEAQWLHAEAADVIQKQRVEIELLRGQLEQVQSTKEPAAKAAGDYLQGSYPEDLSRAPPGPRLTLTKNTISDMMPRLPLTVVPSNPPVSSREPLLLSRETTAAVIERRLAGGDIQAWEAASPLLNPLLLPTAPVDCARYTTQRRDVGLAAPLPQGPQAQVPVPVTGSPPPPIPQDLLGIIPGAGPATSPLRQTDVGLPAYHPQRYQPPRGLEEALARNRTPPRATQPPNRPSITDVGHPTHPELAGGVQPVRPNRSPSLKKILSGRASMLSITHVDPRAEVP
eukprot:Hpha_TRINITY_DN15041_c0_g6::TRINITY_DN15041_c0_g6_i1::g.123039::m.123039